MPQAMPQVAPLSAADPPAGTEPLWLTFCAVTVPLAGTCVAFQPALIICLVGRAKSGGHPVLVIAMEKVQRDE